MLGNFSAHILVSAIGGFIVAFPLTFGQIWRFIRKPGLHGGEAPGQFEGRDVGGQRAVFHGRLLSATS